MDRNDTIAAIASGITASGIGIIRISGPEAFDVLEKIFRPVRPANVKEYKTYTIHYGKIYEGPSGDAALIDECLVMIMRAPRSYTTEDTAEINCHGGLYVMRRVLSAVLSAGARMAEPGEFTKRAYLGGRLDLSSAEAVMDVISSRSEEALKTSLAQLSGSVYRAVSSLREKIMNELAYIEAALDDPEHMDLEGYPEQLGMRVAGIRKSLERLFLSFGEGRLIREGILTVIIGKPNTGKSSLLNALTGEDRAIVTEIEGTTRDILEERVELGGLTLRVIDTAGIRLAKDRIEQIGIERAKSFAERADLILAVFDSARALDDNDREILDFIRERRAVLILNKSDLPAVLDKDVLGNYAGKVPLVHISAREGEGFDVLEREIRNIFFARDSHLNEETMLTNVRHRDAAKRAYESLGLVEKSIGNGLPEDFFSIDLMDAYAALGEIIGEDVTDDLADAIFSKFCMGK